ncbi:hypothetical protein GCM10023196_036240 [Actinoallomurus vinaceus]|uniref:Smf/DprA SLOG domain-containing protein n=1 Tax=Actinoallomurus vinaceus TaxID=1080074 RepID=A0ABP8UAI7_9ACTN
MISAEERRARALLTRIAEPGDELLGRLLAAEGAIGTLNVINSDAVPDSCPPDSRPADSGRGDPGRRFAAWRARLPDAEPERLLSECDALGGRLVCPGDAEWPSQLDDLGDRRPYALWVRGDEDLRFSCLRSVAIVGSRSATSYGVNVAAEMGAELADRKWTVVSSGVAMWIFHGIPQYHPAS